MLARAGTIMGTNLLRTLRGAYFILFFFPSLCATYGGKNDTETKLNKTILDLTEYS
jgi:hypothetical protein